jgi:hypothetical protein
MTASVQHFQVGMRVVVRDGEWPHPRVAGHYGKITVIHEDLDLAAPIGVDITGHIDGEPPYDFASEGWSCWYPEELEVVD